MVNARGFTLVELLVALFIAALISIALSVVFRMGMGFVSRSRSYYSGLQESLAVVAYLRRSVSHIALDKVSGSDSLVLLQSSGKADGSGSGYVCRAVDDEHWVLESFTLKGKPSKDQNSATGQATSSAPNLQGQAQAPGVDAAKPTDQPVMPNDEQLNAAKRHLLLDGLTTCGFEYLMGKKVAANGLSVNASNTNQNTPPPSAFEWHGQRDKGELAAIRISLATADAALPPIVLAPVK
jgi:prepilin-type N-terminal cleavage/methylation domain-containing protein